MASQPFNIVLAGAFGVGKTTIFQYLQDRRCNETVLDKTGKSSRKWDKWTHETNCPRSGNKVQVVLWDTGGMEECGIRNMTRSYFAQSIGIILVYDKGDLDSLYHLRDWVERAQEESTLADHIVFSLWCNDTGNDTNPVPDDTAEDFAQQLIPPELVGDVSAKTGQNVDESYQNMIEAVYRRNQGPIHMEGSSGAWLPKRDEHISEVSVSKHDQNPHQGLNPNLHSDSMQQASVKQDSHKEGTTIVPTEQDGNTQEQKKKGRCRC